MLLKVGLVQKVINMYTDAKGGTYFSKRNISGAVPQYTQMRLSGYDLKVGTEVCQKSHYKDATNRILNLTFEKKLLKD